VCDVDTLKAQREELKPEKITLDDTCFLQFTSGSTSRPKGVTLTHANLAANVHAIMDLGLKVQSFDKGVSWLPLYHDMGLIGFVLSPLYHVNSITFLPPLLFLKRPARWLEHMSREGTIVRAQLRVRPLRQRIKERDQGLDLSSWRVAGCGAEPIHAENLQRSLRNSVRSASTRRRSSAVTAWPVDARSLLQPHRRKRADRQVEGAALWAEGLAKAIKVDGNEAEKVASVVSCGAAFPEHEIAVFAETDAESATPLPERSVGELRLRGPSVMVGYWNDAELTREARRRLAQDGRQLRLPRGCPTSAYLRPLERGHRQRPQLLPKTWVGASRISTTWSRSTRAFCPRPPAESCSAPKRESSTRLAICFLAAASARSTPPAS
jgi:acyl-CoA synthetase (AMP-forming)/AMP-acid ligase II